MRATSVAFRSVIAGVAALAATASFTAAAQAQDLIDFLWGGGDEWGGGRQTVTFDQQYRPNQIIVSFGDRRLYLITKPGIAISYPIAAPREQSRWQGKTTVSSKKENPSWTPTPDMFKENPKLPSWVPGGHPMNPLGVRAMYLGSSTYRIHGTDAPWTIGQAVSKGCIRMYNEDVLDLYPRVPVGMTVTVTWERFKTEAASSEVARLEGTNHKASDMPKTYGSSHAEPTPVADKPVAEAKEPAVVDSKDEPAVEPKKASASKSSTGVEENFSDDGYTVDNSAGGKRATKIGRKPLVTRTSANAE
jgi:lipoprotein-anchoring transpeptidase ErfK/SrfK